MSGPETPRGGGPDTDPVALSALLAELQATAEQLGAQLGELGRASADAAAGRAEAIPAVRRLLEIAPPELRQRLASAATSGLSATRDLADWLLAQMSPEAPRSEPEELPITRIPTPGAAPTLHPVPTTWILTASVENHRVTEAREFSVIGVKERNRARAMELEPGDVVVLYLTKVKAFAGAIRITGDVFEDREKLWPGQPKNPDPYPWRLATEPVLTLPEDRWIPAETLKSELEHVQKWPADHWTLAFQGQLRTVSERDGALLLDRLGAAAGQPA